MSKPTDLTGVVLQEGALVALAVLSGRSADIDFRVVCEVTDEGRVKVRGLGGDNPVTKPSFISYPERTVHLEACWAYEWEPRIIAEARRRMAGLGMEAPAASRTVDVEDFCLAISGVDYAEPEFFAGAVRAIIHNEAMAEWHRAYRS